MTGRRLLLLIAWALLAVASARANSEFAEVETLIGQGQASEAEDLMEARLEDDAQDQEARYWLARAELAQIDDASVFRKPLLARSARQHLERVLEQDPGHLAAREALARYLMEAPAIVGGSMERAQAQADLLLEQDPVTGYRVKSSIALRSGDDEQAVRMLEKALASEAWNWEAQYRLVILAVHRQTDGALEVLDEADSNVRTHADSPEDRLPLLDYQRGKLAAIAGVALEPGRVALTRYLGHEPAEGEPDLVWAEFRLAQVERQLDMTDAAQARLEKLEHSEVPEGLEIALLDERRWHY